MAKQNKISADFQFNIDLLVKDVGKTKKQIENILKVDNLGADIQKKLTSLFSSLEQSQKRLSKSSEKGFISQQELITVEKLVKSIPTLISKVERLSQEASMVHLNPEFAKELKRQGQEVDKVKKQLEGLTNSIEGSYSTENIDNYLKQLDNKISSKQKEMKKKLSEINSSSSLGENDNFTRDYEKIEKTINNYSRILSQVQEKDKERESITEKIAINEAKINNLIEKRKTSSLIKGDSISLTKTEKQQSELQNQLNAVTAERGKLAIQADVRPQSGQNQIELKIIQARKQLEALDERRQKAADEYAKIQTTIYTNEIKSLNTQKEKIIALQKETVEKEEQLRILQKQSIEEGSIDTASISLANQELTKLTNSSMATASGFENITGQMKFMGGTLEGLGVQIGYFLSLDFIFDRMVDTLREATQSVQEIDKDMTQIGLVLGTTSGEVWNKFNEYSDFANELNSTTSEVTESMKLFYQQGLNTSEVNYMVEASAMAAALGESTLSEASETLTAVMNSYNISANEALTVTDKMSQVAIASAADFGELSAAVEKVASSAASAGLDLDHVMGYLGKMIETTREAPANLGTALKTIVANFTEFREDPSGLAESGTEINKVATALDSVGIELTNSQGEVRDLSMVLDELGGKWDTLDRNQRSYLATQIAGNRQQSRFYALMNEYDRTMELVSESSNSAGKAQEQFALYSNSLEASTKRLTNQWEIFIQQITSGNGVVKIATDGLTSLMEVVNSIGPIGTVLGLTTFIKQMTGAVSSVNSFKTKMSNLNDVFITQGSLEGQNALAKQTAGMSSFDAKSLTNMIKYSSEIRKINGELQVNTSKITSLKLNAQKFGAQAKLSFTTAGYAVKAFGKALASAGVQMLAMAAIGFVFEQIATAIDDATVSAEEFKEVADAANESATLVKALRDEYEDLANTINRTAEEEARIKEIISEVSKETDGLTDSLASNTSAFKDNLSIMDDYIDSQLKIQGVNDLLAAQKSVEEENNWWNSFTRMFNGDTADSLEEGTFEGYYSQTESGVTNKYGLTGTQQDILSSYSAELIDSYNNFTPQDWLDNFDNFANELDAFALKISKMTLAEQADFETFNAELLDSSNSFNDLRNELDSLNLSQEMKDTFLSEIDTQDYNAQQTISERNPGLDYSTVLKMVDELPRQVLTDLYNPENIDSLTEEETEQYYAGLGDIFKDADLTQAFFDAIEKDSENGASLFFSTLTEESTPFISILQDVSGGLTTFDTVVENSISALEKMQDSLNIATANSELTVLDTVDKLLSNELNIRDMGLIGNSSMLSINLDGQIAQMRQQFSELKKPFEDAIAGIDEGISTTSNPDEIIKNLETEIQSAQSSLDDNILRMNEQLEAVEYSSNNYLAAVKQSQEKKESQGVTATLGMYAPPGISTGIVAGSYFSDNGEALVAEREGIKEAEQAEYYRIAGEVQSDSAQIEALNQQLEEQKRLKDLILMTDEQILALSKEEVMTEIAKNEALNTEIRNEEGEVVGKINQDILNKNLLLDDEEGNKYLAERTVQDLDFEGEVWKENLVLYEEAIELKNEYYKETKNNTIESIEDSTKALEEQKEGFENVLTAIEALEKESLHYLETQTAVFESFANAGQVQDEINSIAEAYELAGQGAQSYFDVASMIAEDPSLIQALDMESEYLQFNQEAVANLAKEKVNAQIVDVKSRLEGVNAIIGMIQAQMNGETLAAQNSAEMTGEKLKHVSMGIAAQESLTSTEQNATDIEGQNLEISVSNWSEWQNQVIAAIQHVENARAQMAENAANNTTTASTFETQTFSMSSTGGVTADVGEDIDLTQANQDYDNLVNTIQSSSSDQLSGMLSQYQTTKAILEKSLASLQSIYNSGGEGIFDAASGGYGDDDGGSDDAYEGSIEKLEKFYNYLRQIEELEARIEKIRNKRDITDTTQNYFVDALAQENALLREQAELYGDYISDQGTYLADLRAQIQAAYGDWAYFADSGAVQVTQTEFNINSEAEEERYDAFSEILGEYENQYNTWLENQNTLLEIQVTIIENIESSYDKIIAKLDDAMTNLEHINELIEHNADLTVGNLDQLDSYNAQLTNTIKMYEEARTQLAALEKDMQLITQEINSSNLNGYVDFNQDTNQYQVSDKFNQDNLSGIIDSNTATQVQSLVAASQKVNEEWREVSDTVMSIEQNFKSLVENRLESVTEIIESWTTELEKVYDIVNRQISTGETIFDLTGYDTGDLENHYKVIASAAATTKKSWEEMEILTSQALSNLTKEFGDYVQIVNGTPFINSTALEESTTLTDQQKAQAKELIATYESLRESTDSLEDSTYEYLDTLKQLQENQLQQTIEILQELRDELRAIDEEELSDLEEKYSKMNSLDQEYYSNLTQKISDARNQRNLLQGQEDINQQQQYLGAIQRDTSGTYNAEVASTQSNVNSLMQNQADSEVDSQLEQLQREQEERQEDREIQLQQLENMITFKDETGAYWTEANALLDQGFQAVSGFLAMREQNADQSELATQEAIAQTNQQLVDVYAKLGDYSALDLQTSSDIKNMLNQFINGEGNSVSGLLGQLGVIDQDLVNNLTKVTNDINSGFSTSLAVIQAGYSQFWSQFDSLRGSVTSSGSGIIGALNSQIGSSNAQLGNINWNAGQINSNTSGLSGNASQIASNTGSGGGGVGQSAAETKANTDYMLDLTKWISENISKLYVITDARLQHQYTVSLSGASLSGGLFGGGASIGAIKGNIYKEGGYVNYTGPAWVDGTNSKPEAFLNAKQTVLFENLRDSLSGGSSGAITTGKSNEISNNETINVSNVTVEVKEIADIDSVNSLTDKIKTSIYNDATRQNKLQVKRR